MKSFISDLTAWFAENCDISAVAAILYVKGETVIAGSYDHEI